MLALPTTGCKSIFEDNEYSGAKVATDDQDDGGNVDVPENPDDYTLSTDTSKIAYIHCKNTSFAVDGNASLVDIKTTGVKIELKKPGTFYIDGTLDDGQIQVDADSADIVKVVFNGVSLNCSSEAAFRVKDCSKTIVTLADGTTNTISDGISVLLTIGRLFLYNRPLEFFSIMAGLLTVIAVGFFIPVFIDYLDTGLVKKFPTLIVCSFTMMAALLSFFAGVILSVIRNQALQDFELNRTSVHARFVELMKKQGSSQKK